MKKLAIIATHPVQYYAPVFQLLHQRQQIELTVFYTWGKKAVNSYDPGFEKNIDWDIPLLDGYNYQWVDNSAKQPGSHHFSGIVNPGLIKQIEAFKPDTLLIIGWAYNSHLKALRYFNHKIPVWFRGDSTLIAQPKGIKSFLRNLFLKWVYSHVDGALYTGTNNKLYFENYGLKGKQLKLAPHAIDNNRFSINRQPEAVDLKQQHGIGADDLLVLFAGKFEEKKNPGLLLDAFIKAAKPNTHLLFVGSGRLENWLRQKAAGQANIHFMDFQNQNSMPVVYQACDLFCLPSQGRAETWGLAVNEAMACGKPILVSDECGCAIDLVKPGVNGFIFKSNQLNELVDCLDKLCRSKELLRNFGDASAKIIKDFSFLAVAMAVENVVNET